MIIAEWGRTAFGWNRERSWRPSNSQTIVPRSATVTTCPPFNRVTRLQFEHTLAAVEGMGGQRGRAGREHWFCADRNLHKVQTCKASRVHEPTVYTRVYDTRPCERVTCFRVYGDLTLSVSLFHFKSRDFQFCSSLVLEIRGENSAISTFRLDFSFFFLFFSVFWRYNDNRMSVVRTKIIDISGFSGNRTKRMKFQRL